MKIKNVFKKLLPAFLVAGFMGLASADINWSRGGINVEEGNVNVSTAARAIDFDSTQFNVSDSPAREANITINTSSIATRGDVVLNQNPLQSGTTFHVSSGTVQNHFHVSDSDSRQELKMLHSTLPRSGGAGPQVVDTYLYGKTFEGSSVSGSLMILASTNNFSEADLNTPPSNGSYIQINPYSGGTLSFIRNGTQAFNVSSSLDCTGNANGGALTANGTGVLSCTDDDNSGGGGGANIEVEDGGSSIVNTSTVNFTGAEFIVTASGGEALVKLDQSSVTLLGSTLGGNLSGSLSSAVVADDSHNHVITNIDSFTKAQLETQVSDVSDFAEADGDTYTGTHNMGGAVLEIPNAANPTVDATGEIALDTTDNGLVAYDGQVAHVIAHATHTALISISSGIGYASMDVPIFAAPENMAVTITKIETFTIGTSSVTYSLEEKTFAQTSAGTDVFTVAESTAHDSGNTYTSFSNASIAAGSYIHFTTDASASAGTPTMVTIKIVYYKERE